MFELVLNFLGFRISGFKRHNGLIIFITKFRNSRYIRNSITYFFSIFFLLFIFIGSYLNLNYINSFSKNTYNLLLPVKLFCNDIIDFPLSISEYILKNKSLKKEIEELKTENDKLKIILINTKNLEKEVNDLKNFMNLKYSISNYKVVEKVLGFDKGIYESFMLISATHENVQEGAVVISSDGLVGIIHSVKNNVAKVIHICDTKFNVPVRSESGEHLIISGDGKNHMISKEFDKSLEKAEISLNKSEVLYTSGEGGVFQSGIPVATISNIYYPNFIEAIPNTKLNSISYVWIIDPVITNTSSE